MIKNILFTLLVLYSFEAFSEDQHEILEASNPIIVDVRTDAEWNNGYIETAIHIPLDVILQRIELVTENKEQNIYLYLSLIHI